MIVGSLKDALEDFRQEVENYCRHSSFGKEHYEDGRPVSPTVLARSSQPDLHSTAVEFPPRLVAEDSRPVLPTVLASTPQREVQSTVFEFPPPLVVAEVTLEDVEPASPSEINFGGDDHSLPQLANLSVTHRVTEQAPAAPRRWSANNLLWTLVCLMAFAVVAIALIWSNLSH